MSSQCKVANSWMIISDMTAPFNILFTGVSTHLSVDEKFSPHGLREHLVCHGCRHEAQEFCTQYKHSDHRQDREHIHHLSIGLEAWQQKTQLLQLPQVKGCSMNRAAHLHFVGSLWMSRATMLCLPQRHTPWSVHSSCASYVLNVPYGFHSSQ